MKLLLILLSFFILATTSNITKEQIDNTQNSFLENVDKNYASYEIYETDENDLFSVLVVRGIYNGSACYGVSFISASANEYYMVLETKSSAYSLQDTGINESAMAIKADIEYSAVVYNKSGNKVKTKAITLSKFVVGDFDEANATVGQGNGTSFTKLSEYKARLPYLPVLLIILGSLTCLSGLAIFLLFIFRKGLFNKDKRKEGVISMRDIYEAETEDIGNDGISFDYKEEHNLLETSDDITPVTNPNKREEDDEVNSKIENIKDYLKDKGFIVDYNILDEDEKNKIMMELIKLKNDGLISMDAYYKETYELWKK